MNLPSETTVSPRVLKLTKLSVVVIWALVALALSFYMGERIMLNHVQSLQPRNVYIHTQSV